jgi:hypothetical protein
VKSEKRKAKSEKPKKSEKIKKSEKLKKSEKRKTKIETIQFIQQVFLY